MCIGKISSYRKNTQLCANFKLLLQFFWSYLKQANIDANDNNINIINIKHFKTYNCEMLLY